MNLEIPSIEWMPLLVIAASAAVMIFLARRALRGMNQQDWILLRKCRAMGVDLKRPHVVTFVIFAANEQTAAEVAQRMHGEGYVTATKVAQIQFARNRRKPGAPQDGWLVSGTRSVDVAPETLIGIRKTLNAMATEYKALYLGWQLADSATALTTPVKAEQGATPASSPVSERTPP